MVVREARELEEKTEGREGKGVYKDYVVKAFGWKRENKLESNQEGAEKIFRMRRLSYVYRLEKETKKQGNGGFRGREVRSWESTDVQQKQRQLLFGIEAKEQGWVGGQIKVRADVVEEVHT